MKLKNVTCFFIVFSLILSFHACKKDDENKLPDLENDFIVHWIYDVMEVYYFWNEDVKQKAPPTGFENPTSYFNSLLNDLDSRSFIVDDFKSINENEASNKIMGYSLAFGYFEELNQYFLIIECVNAGTPAFSEGLKRGDIISKINGLTLTSSNVWSLLNQDAYTITLSELVNNELVIKREIYLDALDIEINPVVYDTIFTELNRDVGYIVLSEFTERNSFIKYIDPVLSEFKSEGIDALIVDLRYNRGSDIDAGIWFASSIVPQKNAWNNDIFVKLIYNSDIQKPMDAQYLSSIGLEATNVNILLENVYFLTSGNGTSFVSELVINSLKPYMNVIQVGENTYGKNMGFWGFADYNEYPRHNYGIVIAAYKYANASGKSDFNNGLIADYFVSDYLVEAFQFGDTRDPILLKSLELFFGDYKSNFLTKDQNYTFKTIPISKKTPKIEPMKY